MDIPYVDLAKQHAPLLSSVLENVERVLRHGQFINGPEVQACEAALGRLLGVEHVIGVASGTAALTLALRTAGVGQGDEVITVSHSYFATASAIALVGATPVFVDVDPHTALMDPSELEAALSARTKAVMPVHLGGTACEMNPIVDFCESNHLHLVEDCAQSIGATYEERSVGSFGTGCFSLHPLKVLSACGDAGFVTTNDAEAADELRKRRNLGHRDRDHVELVSENARLDTLQAAILLAKLPCLPSWITARRNHAAAYDAALANQYELTRTPARAESVYSTYVVRTDHRDDLLHHLHEHGIDAKVHYPVPIHRQAPFVPRETRPLPHTERIVERIVSLPVSPELEPSERARVIEALQRWEVPLG